MFRRIFQTFPVVAAALAWAGLGCVEVSVGAEPTALRQRPAPFTVRFDVGDLLAERAQQTLPLWLEGVMIQRYPREGELGAHTAVRLHLRKLAALAPVVELRVGLAAGRGTARALAWSETGRQIFRSEPFGSETEAVTELLRIPAEGANYIELELPGKGEALTELFASAMRYTQVLHPVDFAPEPVSDAFENAAASSVAAENDSLLWSRVHAPLDAGPFTLENGGSGLIEFELLKRPECALITFEMRHSEAGRPPLVSVNGQDLPGATPLLPDLADPAWKLRPAARSAPSQMVYSGWLRVQQFVPGSVLVKGQNTADISLAASELAADIRRVEIQLRYRPSSPSNR
jgi:hypothetical protein